MKRKMHRRNQGIPFPLLPFERGKKKYGGDFLVFVVSGGFAVSFLGVSEKSRWGGLSLSPWVGVPSFSSSGVRLWGFPCDFYVFKEICLWKERESVFISSSLFYFCYVPFCSFVNVRSPSSWNPLYTWLSRPFIKVSAVGPFFRSKTGI